MSYIIGIDHTKETMGVCIVDTDTLKAEWWRRYEINLVDKGWQHEQVHAALANIPPIFRAFASHWVRANTRYDYTEACIDVACHRTMRGLIHLPDPTPAEWRKANGLPGNCGAAVYWQHANETAHHRTTQIAFPSETEAAAYLIAVAALKMETTKET